MLLLSDLYEEPARVISALGPLRDAGHDVVVMQLLDPMERTFDFSDAATFEDVESGVRLPVVPSRLRAEYQRLVSRAWRRCSGGSANIASTTRSWTPASRWTRCSSTTCCVGNACGR
ncbi:MAG: hypothetical protein IPF47_18265 [Gemmatimonadetes bacterium]|nr:hypothetical protein [Gemmatimonadota bacterium]